MLCSGRRAARSKNLECELGWRSAQSEASVGLPSACLSVAASSPPETFAHCEEARLAPRAEVTTTLTDANVGSGVRAVHDGYRAAYQPPVNRPDGRHCNARGALRGGGRERAAYILVAIVDGGFLAKRRTATGRDLPTQRGV